MAQKLWHTYSIAKTFDQLKSSKKGLGDSEVSKRLKSYGYNKLPQSSRLTKLEIILTQFKSPLVYVLLFAAGISIYLQDFVDTAIILVAVFINTFLGFYQENKANNSIEYLRKLIHFKAKVLRNGNEISVDTSELVPGDIIFLEAGDKIPADARLIKIDNFQVIEAALTGEATPARKSLKATQKGEVISDRNNMVYSGTVVASGRAMAVVCETGQNTEIGKITLLVKETKEEKTPLQQQLDVFSRNLTYAVIFFVALIVIIGKVQGREIFGFGHAARESMLNVAAAIAVAAIPEGLLISVTVVLAIGMQAILRRKALVRKLIAAETLGSVSIICTDKTGTLTEGKMQVSRIITAGDDVDVKNSLKYQNTAKLKDHDLISKISLLCNNAVIENPNDELAQLKILGNPTEQALLLGAMQAGIPAEEVKKHQPRIAEIPFDSKWKYMATLNELDKNKNVVYVKGAPEVVFSMASKIRVNGKKLKLTEERKKELKNKFEKLTNDGLRLLAFAYKQTSPKNTHLKDELNDLIFIGFIALKDPLRAEAKETMKQAQKAGIRPIIITGDHKLTAKAIVSELGLKVDDKNIMLGSELDQISDEDFEKIIQNIDIYARVEPKHKLRIIKAWQKKGETVAMTGDGVNDAPALKAADVGIALGSGTDVAKETSDIILLDNNFKTIVAAVERGRVIFDNIKKVTLYLLSDSFSEMILISGALFLKLPLPILPAQIIWINLINDGFPSLALTLEPGEKKVMHDKPRKKNAKILDKELKILIFVAGTVTDVVILGLYYYLIKHGGYTVEHARTLIFALIGLDSLFYVFSCRSLRQTIFTKNPLTNKYLLASIAIGIGLQLIAIYSPFFQKIFDTIDLDALDWLMVAIVAIIKILSIESVKYFFIIKNRKAA